MIYLKIADTVNISTTFCGCGFEPNIVHGKMMWHCTWCVAAFFGFGVVLSMLQAYWGGLFYTKFGRVWEREGIVSYENGGGFGFAVALLLCTDYSDSLFCRTPVLIYIYKGWF